MFIKLEMKETLINHFVVFWGYALQFMAIWNILAVMDYRLFHIPNKNVLDCVISLWINKTNWVHEVKNSHINIFLIFHGILLKQIEFSLNIRCLPTNTLRHGYVRLISRIVQPQITVNKIIDKIQQCHSSLPWHSGKNHLVGRWRSGGHLQVIELFASKVVFGIIILMSC